MIRFTSLIKPKGQPVYPPLASLNRLIFPIFGTKNQGKRVQNRFQDDVKVLFGSEKYFKGYPLQYFMKHPRIIEIAFASYGEVAYVYFSDQRSRKRDRGTTYNIISKSDLIILLEKEPKSS